MVECRWEARAGRFECWWGCRHLLDSREVHQHCCVAFLAVVVHVVVLPGLVSLQHT